MSAFYTSPLVVLDFQSLYPSVMIAYNYCYSTCLGRIKPFQGNYKFGVTNLDLGPGILDALQEHITGSDDGSSLMQLPDSCTLQLHRTVSCTSNRTSERVC